MQNTELKPVNAIWLPWPPATGNHRNARSGKRVYRKREVDNYYQLIGLNLRHFERPAGAICIGACFCYPKDGRRKADLTNLWKVLEDALVDAGFLVDDGPNYLRHISLSACPTQADHPQGVIRLQWFEASE